MKACVLHAIGDLRCEDTATPTPAPGEVLLRIGACGVCGSDIPRVFTKGTYHFPTIPGHEFSATVAEVGEGVSADWVGREAAVFPLIPCRNCEACAAGDYQLCNDYDYLGSRRDGAFAEYVCAPQWNLEALPEGVGLVDAAMTEPAAVALHALRRGNVSADDRVLIYGAGPIGLLTALWAKSFGVTEITIADVDPSRVDFARTLDLGRVVNPATEADDLGDGFTAVVEASGNTRAFADAIGRAQRQGTVILLGNPDSDMTLPATAYSAILRNELTLVGSWNSSYGDSERNEWRMVLEAIAAKRLDLSGLVTHRVGLDALPDALAMLRDHREPAAKVMFVNEGTGA